MKALHGGVPGCVAQEIPQIDAEISEKGYLRTETSYIGFLNETNNTLWTQSPPGDRPWCPTLTVPIGIVYKSSKIMAKGLHQNSCATRDPLGRSRGSLHRMRHTAGTMKTFTPSHGYVSKSDMEISQQAVRMRFDLNPKKTSPHNSLICKQYFRPRLCAHFPSFFL
jgi:hypothetical protein